MKELLGEMLETEGNWIGGLAAVGAVLGGIGFFFFVIYLWFQFPAEFPWYGWLLLVAMGGVGGTVAGALAGVGLYLAFVISLGLALAALILGGLGLVIMAVLTMTGLI